MSWRAAVRRAAVATDRLMKERRFSLVEIVGIMVEEGAAVIDIGGESTRPSASAVTAEEEQARVLPIIEALASSGEALISVDTYREDTARLAVAAGAHIVNDVWGLQREPDIARVAAETGAGLIIMKKIG